MGLRLELISGIVKASNRRRIPFDGGLPWALDHRSTRSARDDKEIAASSAAISVFVAAFIIGQRPLRCGKP